MSAAAPILRPEAIEIAKAFVDALDGTYLDLRVAGSLRRKMGVVHDVEIVAIPKVERITGGLFDEDMGPLDMLDARMMALRDNAEVVQRRKADGSLMSWGPTWKSVTYRGAAIDLFTPNAERFGWILLLRTGPAPFSRQLVVPKRDDRGRPGRTKDGRPGLLPIHIKPDHGWLTERVSGYRISTPTEESVYELFGLPYQQPWERV